MELKYTVELHLRCEEGSRVQKTSYEAYITISTVHSDISAAKKNNMAH